MSKPKRRKCRWTYREILKRHANRHKAIWAMHPQVRRQVDEERSQRGDQS